VPVGRQTAPAVIGTETAAEVLKTNGAKGHAANGAAPGHVLSDVTRDSIQALMIIRSHRVRGHLYAELDPLGLEQPLSHTELDPESYGFTEADYDREIYIHDRLGLGEKAPLRDIVEKVRATYCGHIGVEYMHMTSTEEKVWIQDRIEGIRNQTDFTDMGKNHDPRAVDRGGDVRTVSEREIYRNETIRARRRGIACPRP
jgi:2-oxoglutarate dehydrogenase complex dehydrogenase (E1) component-like enzyme